MGLSSGTQGMELRGWVSGLQRARSTAAYSIKMLAAAEGTDFGTYRRREPYHK